MSSIFRELAEVQRQLTALPKDAEAQRYVLLDRQEDLQTRAARLADQVDEDCSTQDLLARLAELRWQHRALDRQRTAASGRPGMRGETGSRPSQTQSSESRIETRIRRIQLLLSQRGIDIH